MVTNSTPISVLKRNIHDKKLLIYFRYPYTGLFYGVLLTARQKMSSKVYCNQLN